MDGSVLPAIRRDGFWTRLRSELSGGLAIFVITLPQAVAYGSIAFFPLGPAGIGVGIVAALVSSVLLCTATPLFGAPPGMAFGPRASSALIFASLLALLLGRGVPPATAVALCFTATCLSGLFQALLGLFRMGTLGQYIPYPLVSGIMNGTALLIIGREMMDIAGVAPGLDASTLSRMAAGLAQPAPWLAIGVAALILLLRRFRRFLPPHLAAVVIGAGVYHLIAARATIDLGGTYPPLTFDQFDAAGLFMGLSADLAGAFRENMAGIVSAAAALAMLESLDSLISGAVYGRLIESRVRGNRLLIAQGAANVVCGLCGGLSGSGSVVRTLANFRAGGRASLSVVSSALLLVVFTGFFGGALSYLPIMVISGLLLVIGIEIVDTWALHQIRSLYITRLRNWRSVAPDLVLIAAVVMTAAVSGLPAAVGVGMLAALGYFAYLQSRSLIRRTLHGDKTHSRTLRDARAADALRRHGRRIIVLELEGALFFASTEQLEKSIETYVERGADHIILDMRRVISIDTSGVESLKGLWSRLGNRGVYLAISHVAKERRKNRSPIPESVRTERRRNSSRREIWRRLEDGDAFGIVSRDRFFSDTDSALAFCEERILSEHADPRPPRHRPAWDALDSVMFNGLSPGELRTVRRHMSSHRFAAGSVIFSRNDAGREVYFLRQGVAHVLIPVSGSERQVRISTLLPGALFGEMALFGNGTRSADVAAESDCLCYRLTIENLERLKRNHPHTALTLFENLGRLFAARLQDANDLIRELEA